MTRTGQDAIDYARGRVGNGPPPPAGMHDPGMCLAFVRECFGVGSYYPSAIDAWNNAGAPHPGDRNPPPAVPLYFRSPSIYDHVVFCAAAGGHELITTFNDDVRSYSGPDAIAQVCRDFDAELLGWAEDINTVTVYEPGQESDDMDANELTAILRSEGVTGAGDAVHMLQAGYTQGITDAVTATLRSEGVTGAADGTLPLVQTYVRQVVADEIEAALTGPVGSSRSTTLFVFALVVLIAVVGGVAVGLLSDTQSGVVAGIAAIVGGLFAIILRNLPRSTP